MAWGRFRFRVGEDVHLGLHEPRDASTSFGTTGDSHVGVRDATEVGKIRVMCSGCGHTS